MNVRVTVFIEETDTGYYAYSPTMPGLHVEGGTEAEVKQNVEDAVVAYIISLLKHSDPLPIAEPVPERPHAQAYTFTQNIPAFA